MRYHMLCRNLTKIIFFIIFIIFALKNRILLSLTWDSVALKVD